MVPSSVLLCIMNRILLVVLMLLATVATWAQGTVRGHVAEKQTDEALEFANVRILQGTKFVKGAITASNGIKLFVLQRGSGDRFVLLVRYNGRSLFFLIGHSETSV